MKPVRLECRTRWGAAFLLSLLLLAPGAGRDALAGCGHRLESRFDHPTDGYHLDPLIAGDASSAAAGPARRVDGPRPDRPAPAPGPCSGPGCSGRAPMPAPSVLHATDGPSHWGSLAAAVALPSRTFSGRVGDAPLLASASRSISIFHPPRF